MSIRKSFPCAIIGLTLLITGCNEELTEEIKKEVEDKETFENNVILNSEAVIPNYTATTLNKLNDTGVIQCSDFAYRTGSHTFNRDTDCTATTEVSNGDDPIPYGQDAHHGRDQDPAYNSDDDGKAGFSFTKLDPISGGELAATTAAGTWGCVKDNVTGLTWEVKQETGLRAASHRYTWYNSTGINDGGSAGINGHTTYLTNTIETVSCSNSNSCDSETFVSEVNNLAQPLCGSNQWRLPTREELRSIVDYSQVGTAIDIDYFPHAQPNWYWSSSPYALGSWSAWRIHFYDGYHFTIYKGAFSSIRLVHD